MEIIEGIWGKVINLIDEFNINQKNEENLIENCEICEKESCKCNCIGNNKNQRNVIDQKNDEKKLKEKILNLNVEKKALKIEVDSVVYEQKEEINLLGKSKEQRKEGFLKSKLFSLNYLAEDLKNKEIDEIINKELFYLYKEIPEEKVEDNLTKLRQNKFAVLLSKNIKLDCDKNDLINRGISKTLKIQVLKSIASII